LIFDPFVLSFGAQLCFSLRPLIVSAFFRKLRAKEEEWFSARPKENSIFFTCLSMGDSNKNCSTTQRYEEREEEEQDILRGWGQAPFVLALFELQARAGAKHSL